MDVHLIPWPSHEARRVELCESNEPRMLMVAPDAVAPLVSDELEDWIRLPASQEDLRARVAALQARCMRRADADAPKLGSDGVLRCGAQTTVLPPVEQRLTAALLERFGVVVGRDVLLRAGWPDERPGRNVLDVHMGRLRKHLGSVDLVVKTVRSRGYMLEAGSLPG